MSSMIMCALVIDALETEAQLAFESGTREGMQEGCECLKTLIKYAEAALKGADLTETERAWFQSKMDQAINVLA